MSQFKTFYDQLGEPVSLDFPPTRIISLVPSQTELLFDLGLFNEVVGITRYCVHPAEWQQSKTIVGGTKNFNLDSIHSLRPDLIIGNKEENVKDGIELLRKDFPVWVSDISTLPHALQMMRSLGEITQKELQASLIVDGITAGFKDFRVIPPGLGSVLYLIWRKPWMGAASDTFINEVLQMIGFTNCLQKSIRYPELTPEQISKLSPDYIFLSSEPFPFMEKHIEEISKVSPTSRVVLVDGEMFSWYGSRLLKAPAYFRSLISSLPE